VRGEQFELGEPLSAAASKHLEAAMVLLAQLCRNPSLGAWERAVSSVDA